MGQPATVGPFIMSRFLENKFIPLNWQNKYWSSNKTHRISGGEFFLIKEQGLKLKDDGITYRLNSFGLRCDEFSKNNDNIDHTLFAGCSFTFGESLPYLENWAGRMFKEFSKTINISKYYSLSYGGGSIDYIIENIYRYIEFSGKPNRIFVLFPESKRRMAEHRGEVVVLNPEPSIKKHMEYVWGNSDSVEYQLEKIKEFERYCDTNNIYMLWTSWSDHERERLKGYNSKHFINFSTEYLKSKMINKKNTPPHLIKYYDRARDERHPGIGYNSAIANIFMERYVSENNK